MCSELMNNKDRYVQYAYGVMLGELKILTNNKDYEIKIKQSFEKIYGKIENNNDK